MEDAVTRAVAQARKSSETFRHGAVLLSGRAVVAVGRNRNINSCGLSSIHAEMDAAWKAPARKLRGGHIVVVRLRRDQDFGGSRPCVACARALLRMGVKRVTYSTDDPAAPLVTEALHPARGGHILKPPESQYANSVSITTATCSPMDSRTYRLHSRALEKYMISMTQLASASRF